MAGKGYVSVPAAMAVGIGGIIGAGIFVLSGTAIALAGAYAILAFIMVGAVMLLVALEYGELTSTMPNAKGATYSYVYGAFGSELGFVTGIIQFFGWATAISAIALGFGTYLSALIGVQFGLGSIAYAIMFIIAVSLINLGGINEATRTESFLVAIKLLVLLVFIAYAASVAFGPRGLPIANFSALPSQSGLGPLFAASIAIIFAYSGFQSVTTFTSKIKGGAVGAARAILGAVVISMMIYIGVVVALIAIVPATNYSINADPLSFALSLSHAPRWLSVLVDLGALVATTTAAVAMTMGASRILYQISADGLLPRVLRGYNKRTDSPTNGTFFTAVIAVLMLFSGNIYIIASISNFGSLFTYMLASMCIFHFRRTGSSATLRTPLYPYVPAIVIVAVLVFIASMPSAALYFDILLILGLIVVYYLLRETEHKKPVRIRFFK